MLMFRKQDRERVARGEITVTFRLWQRPHVKAGKRYGSGIARGAIDVLDVQLIPAGMVSKRDVRPSGCGSIAEIWELAGEHTRARVGPDTLLFRVEFRYHAQAPPTPPPADALDVAAIALRLGRMDARSERGPWTLRALELISANPRVPARLLAAEMGWETHDFKSHVRRLKYLGLTISHEVGYELSDAGRQLLTAPQPRPAALAASRQRR
jgi:hypothetical protein